MVENFQPTVERIRDVPHFRENALDEVINYVSANPKKPTFVLDVQSGDPSRSATALISSIETQTETKIDWYAESMISEKSRQALVTISRIRANDSAGGQKYQDNATGNSSGMRTDVRDWRSDHLRAVNVFKAEIKCFGLPANGQTIDDIVDTARKYDHQTLLLEMGLPITASDEELQQRYGEPNRLPTEKQVAEIRKQRNHPLDACINSY